MEDARIAYSSVEIGLDPTMPTLSGGLTPVPIPASSGTSFADHYLKLGHRVPSPSDSVRESSSILPIDGSA
jgi:hypothetical protein